MSIEKVKAVYFSATGTTRKVVAGIADVIAGQLGAECADFDFTLPEARKSVLKFSEDDLVVFGTPVYAGRVPNVLLKYLSTIEGGGAFAIPVVLYGNRDYDSALSELRDILENRGLHTIAAAAFIGEHSFSKILAGGRPDELDMKIIRDFGMQAAEKTKAGITRTTVDVKGLEPPYGGYYQPRDRDGNPVDIRKVKPLTNEDCINCRLCAKKCPMGSINHENVKEFTGICIKCGACIKLCPKQARYFGDAGYLYHKQELEEIFRRRAEPELFV